VNAILALLSGGLFAAGVCISGMVRPSKVLAFLDLRGAWDPSLALVMASALAVHAVAWRAIAGRPRPRFGTAFPPPPSRVIDRRLIGGAAVFGVGWGLAGFCPGPAIVSVVSGARTSLVFVGAMAVAMMLWQRVDRAVG